MEPVTRIEQFNQLVRAFAVVSLLGTLEVAFLWGAYHENPIVSIEAYIGVLTFAMTWWFKSRDDKAAAVTPTTTTTTTAASPGVPSVTKVETSTPPTPSG